MGRTFSFVLRQALLVGLAVLTYFWVRGLTEHDPAEAHENARRLLGFERWLNVDVELGLQSLVHRSHLLVSVANWIYIWGHWPVIIVTLIVLAVRDRPNYLELRNAMFISGAIGIVIFATHAVAPPRLLGTAYVDTVTLHSTSYRVLQPPGLVNKYAALPSLHFGWNLLVGLTWAKLGNRRWVAIAALCLPAAMAFAVVATANHWTIDVVVGGLVALAGLAIERRRRAALGALGALGPTRDRGSAPDRDEAPDGGERVEARDRPEDREVGRHDGAGSGGPNEPVDASRSAGG